MAAVVVCGLAALFSQVLIGDVKQSVDQTRLALAQAKQPTSETPLPPLRPASSQPGGLTPAQWPKRQEVDDVVQQASQTALSQGITIRSLSVSHQTASPAAWGKVTLDVSTTGAYAALKAWQSVLAQRFPALAVQSLRMQAAPAPSVGLDAQWIWVLHVRD